MTITPFCLSSRRYRSVTAGSKIAAKAISNYRKNGVDILDRDATGEFLTVPPRNGHKRPFPRPRHLTLWYPTAPLPWMAPEMKKLLLWLTTLLTAVGLGILAPGQASAATSYCGLAWGSQAKTVPGMSTASVTNVRTGQHYCFDRMVVDLNGPVKGYTAGYVPTVVQDGSGIAIPVRGRAGLLVTVNAPSADHNGNLSYIPADKAELSNVAGYETFRQVVYAGSFEGYTSSGLGIRARLPFRVFSLEGPGNGSRLILDVAHYW